MASRRRAGRPKGGDSRATRERVIIAATGLFATQGYEGTTMVAVAQAADLSGTGLTHHFPTKEDLLQAVLTYRDERDFRTIGIGGKLQAGWAVFDDVARQVEINQNDQAIVRLFTRMVAEATEPTHPGHAWLRRHHAGYRAALSDALERGKSQGSVAEAVPSTEIADLTMAVLDGLQLQWLQDPENFDMRAHLDVFVAGIRAAWEPGPGATSS